MPTRLNVHYRDRSDLPMSDRDIWLDYKNARNRRMQVRILAELNETNEQTIEEIINEQREIEDTIEERRLTLLKEVEQVKQTEEERKAKKAAYMKEYWARKKAEKTTAAPVVEQVAEPVAEPITIPVQSKAPSDPRPDDSELIRKAIQYYSADLADAVMMQRERVEEEQEKLRQMEADLKRCQEILGYELEVEEGEG